MAIEPGDSDPVIAVRQVLRGSRGEHRATPFDPRADSYDQARGDQTIDPHAESRDGPLPRNPAPGLTFRVERTEAGHGCSLGFPYFGSYEHLVQELLGNPLLGGGGAGRPPRVEALSIAPTGYPVPDPWRSGPVEAPWPPPWRAGAAGYLVSVLALREAAAGAGEAGAGVVSSADRAIEQFLDDYCGTTWHVPWPVPGPGPWVFGLASQLGLIAATLQDSSLRGAVQNLAGRVVNKGIAAASGGG